MDSGARGRRQWYWDDSGGYWRLHLLRQSRNSAVPSLHLVAKAGMNDRPERGLTPYGMRDFAGRALDAMRTTRLGWAMNRSFPTVAVRTKQFVDYLLTHRLAAIILLAAV